MRLIFSLFIISTVYLPTPAGGKPSTRVLALIGFLELYQIIASVQNKTITY